MGPELCESFSNSDRPDSLLIVPRRETIEEGDELQLVAYGALDAQNCVFPLEDANQKTNWSVSSGDAVSVDRDGLVRGRDEGRSTVEANFRGVRGTATIVVED